MLENVLLSWRALAPQFPSRWNRPMQKVWLCVQQEQWLLAKRSCKRQGVLCVLTRRRRIRSTKPDCESACLHEVMTSWLLIKVSSVCLAIGMLLPTHKMRKNNSQRINFIVICSRVYSLGRALNSLILHLQHRVERPENSLIAVTESVAALNFSELQPPPLPQFAQPDLHSQKQCNCK